MRLRTKWDVDRIDRMISNGEKRKKISVFSKIHISAIFKDVAHISGESIVIHMYFMCAKTRSCAIISFCAIAIFLVVYFWAKLYAGWVTRFQFSKKILKVQMMYYKTSILDFWFSTVLYSKTVVKVDQKRPSARKWRSGGGRAALSH